jgi:hypothetical protein
MAIKQYLKQFEDFLSQKEVEGRDQPVIDDEKIKEDWLAQIDKFYSLIQNFLDNYLQEGKILKEWKTIQLNEEILGEYEVQQLILKIGNTRVLFTPIGRIILGALGRIDMSSDFGSVRFIVLPKKSNKHNFVSLLENNSPNKQNLDISIQPNHEHDSNMELTWKIITPPPHIDYLEITEESFFEALMEIING